MYQALKDPQRALSRGQHGRAKSHGFAQAAASGSEDQVRGLGAAAIAATLILQSREARAAQPKLLVFLHLPVTQRALQTTLSDALSGITVTAVGRIADFDRAIADGQDALLSLPMVLTSRGASPGLQGYRGGVADENYALVGNGTAPEPNRVKVVGALDVLGRAETTAFVRRVVGGAPSVERVTKVEDLVALLQMQRADSVLLPARLVPEVRKMTRLSLA